MKLYTVEIFVGNGSGEIHAIAACCNGVFIRLHGVAVDEVKMAVLLNAGKQRMIGRIAHFVPAHVRQGQAIVGDKICLLVH